MSNTTQNMAKRPNILFFFTDDQRFDTIQALGNPAIHTPVMDRLVAGGTAFTHAHIPGGTCPAVCMPSRGMLHTGRTLFHLENSGLSVPESHALMGETFRQAAYRTFGTGKWHNGVSAYARSFTDGGDIFFGGMGDHWNVPAFHFDPSGKYDSQLPYCPDYFYSRDVAYRHADHVTAGKHSSELFCDAAISFLDQIQDDTDPFFMYVSFMAPHDPRTMPKEFLDLYDPETIPLPPNFMGGHPFDNGELKIRDEKLEDWPRTPEAIRRHLAEYYAMISHLDAQMGRVLAALQRSGRAENTIILLAGDNGLALGQHGLMGKQSTYDHSVRVPLVMQGPGIPAGQKRDAMVYLLDIFPTLCDLAGLDIPASVDGKSLAPVLKNPDAVIRDRLYLVYKDLHRAVRSPQFKLIEYMVEGRRTTQLFDLIADPWELQNLAGQAAYAEVETALRQDLFRLRDEWEDQNSPEGKRFWSNFSNCGNCGNCVAAHGVAL